MTAWQHKSLYDHIFDRHAEKDNVYAKDNANRDIITTYFRSDEIIDTDDQGRLVGKSIYNGSGPWFSRTMATAFQGSLLSKNIPWIRYMMEQHELKGIDELDIWLQDIKDHMTDAYQRSTFYDVQPQFTHDGVTIGSPVLFGEENIKTGKVMWKPQHYKTVRLYYDGDNQAEGVIIQDKTWTAKQIFDKYIKTDNKNYDKSEAKLPISVVSALRQGRFDDVFTMYRATFKVDDPIWNVQGEDAFKKPTGDWTWLTAYFLELTSTELSKKNTPLNENMGDFTQPFTVWNFDKKPWESSSRTPAYYALWDNLSLQQIDKSYGENIQNIIRPAVVHLDTMKGRLQLGPEGMMAVDEAEYDRPPKPVEGVVGGIQFSKDIMDLKVDALERWFYIKELQMFSNLAAQNKAPVATLHIWQLAGEKATLLSPAIETHSRYLEIADDRMIDIESRAGRGPFNKRRMENIRDIVDSALGDQARSVGVKPVFIGALAQAQKVSQAIQPITSTMDQVGPLTELFPNIPMMYREYETVNDINEALDFPQKNIVPKEEYEEKVRQLNEAAAAQQEAENAVEMMKASKNLQGPVDDTSVMSKVAEAVG